MRTKGWMLCFGALTAGGLLLTNNRELRVSEYKIASERLPEAFEGMKIVLAADLHRKRFGGGYKILVDSVRAAKPDLIVFAGDIYSRDEEHLGAKVRLLGQLSKIAPTFYSTGNHELNDLDRYGEFARAVERAGARVLRNEKFRFERDGAAMDIYGIELPLVYFEGEGRSFMNIPELSGETVEELLGPKEPGVFTVLAAHDPLFLRAYSSWGADVVLSGHVHGGIIRLPLIGGLLSPERRFFPKYSKGLYRMGRTAMAVTAGLGKFRINNPTEIVLLTLTGERQPRKPQAGREWIIG